MFLDELRPAIDRAVGQPIAFLGGFVSGVLRLKLNDDPLKSWLEQQGMVSYRGPGSGNGSGPQSISID
jgi:hypothetical protein